MPILAALGKISNDYQRMNAAISAGAGATGAGTGSSSTGPYDELYQQYLDYIKQFEGTNIYQDLLNNPYAQDVPFSPNFWQSLWETFGDSSARNNYYADRFNSAYEYAAQLQSRLHTEQYNSPAAQEARMNAAGINSQISGGSQISSGETESVAADDTPPAGAVSAMQADNGAGQVMQLGMTIFQNAFSLIGGIQQIHGNSLAMSQQELSLTDQGWNSLIKLAAESDSDWMSASDWNKLSPDDQDAKIAESTRRLIGRIQKGEFSNMYDRKTTRNLVRRLESLLGDGGTDTLGFKNYKNRILKEVYKNADEGAKAIGQFGFSDNMMVYGQRLFDAFSEIDKKIRENAGRLSDAQAASAEAGARSAEAQATYDEQYLTGELGQAENAAGIATADAARVTAEMDKFIDSQLDSLVTDLRADGSLESMMLAWLIAGSRSLIKNLSGSVIGKGMSMSIK